MIDATQLHADIRIEARGDGKSEANCKLLMGYLWSTASPPTRIRCNLRHSAQRTALSALMALDINYGTVKVRYGPKRASQQRAM
jgi:hypothetical protein